MVVNLQGERLGKCDSNGADESSLSEPKSIASSSGSSCSSASFVKSSPSSKIIPVSSVCVSSSFQPLGLWWLELLHVTKDCSRRL